MIKRENEKTKANKNVKEELGCGSNSRYHHSGQWRWQPKQTGQTQLLNLICHARLCKSLRCKRRKQDVAPRKSTTKAEEESDERTKVDAAQTPTEPTFFLAPSPTTVCQRERDLRAESQDPTPLLSLCRGRPHLRVRTAWPI